MDYVNEPSGTLMGTWRFQDLCIGINEFWHKFIVMGLTIAFPILVSFQAFEPLKVHLMHVYLAILLMHKRFLMFLTPCIQYLHLSHEDKFSF